jgi:Protein of unknown function (DUF4232)
MAAFSHGRGLLAFQPIGALWRHIAEDVAKSLGLHQFSQFSQFSQGVRPMKLTQRAGRRLAIGIGAALTAVLAGTAAIAMTAASAAPASPAAPSCVSFNMTVWTGSPGNGTAGSIYWELQISNIGHHACSLYGYPGVSEVNGGGTQVGRPASHSGPKSLVTIPAGGTAHVVLRVTDPGAVCSHPVTGHELKVYAPGQFHAELTPFTASVCPHKVTLHVDAVHAGAGIPNYSNS